MKLTGYLKVDMLRAFGSWKTVVSAMGICVSLIYRSDGLPGVLNWLCNISGNAVLITVSFLFAIYPYAASFCEDMEYHYDRQMILRGNDRSYVISRILTVFLSAMFTMFAGFGLACLFLLRKNGIPDTKTVQNIMENCYSLYSPLLFGKHYLSFAFCTGLHLSLLAGILAVFGLLCSLFVKNRMLVYILPVAFLNVEDIFVQRMMGWERGSLFSLNCMGVTTLKTALATHTWQLYYFEIFALLFFLGAAICLRYRKKVA